MAQSEHSVCFVHFTKAINCAVKKQETASSLLQASETWVADALTSEDLFSHDAGYNFHLARAVFKMTHVWDWSFYRFTSFKKALIKNNKTAPFKQIPVNRQAIRK